MVFYVKPYAKATNEKRSQQPNNMTAPKAYGETISKPSFILREREREVFLNGEVQNIKKTKGFGEQGKVIKKTQICLKGLSVDTVLSLEALRNTANQRKAEDERLMWEKQEEK